MGLVFSERESHAEYSRKIMEQTREPARTLLLVCKDIKLEQDMWKSFVSSLSAGSLGSKEKYQ